MRVPFILIIESLCDLCRSPTVVGAYSWMTVDEKLVDITVKLVRKGSGWNWHGANPIKYHQP